MKYSLLLPVCIISYLAILIPFTSYMKNRPFIEKMGYTPEPGIIRLLSADQKRFVAAALVMKVINYYGGLKERWQNKLNTSPDYPEIERALETAVQLDPYNMDAYYFAQAIMVWEAQHILATNELLEYGMRYRDWDYYLPFFAGFNSAFFLKDFESAAKYYKRVGELTGSDLTINLAGRYLYEAGKIDMAIDYLSMMLKTATNDAIRSSIQTRLQAFLEVRKIERSKVEFHKRYHRLPRSIEELLSSGCLAEKPVDPYGGIFYIDAKGKVRSSSKFAFGVAEKKR